MSICQVLSYLRSTDVRPPAPKGESRSLRGVFVFVANLFFLPNPNLLLSDFDAKVEASVV